MAQVKSKTRKTVKKEKVKTPSRFYVVRNLQEARDNLTDRLDEYNAKYIKKPIENGKEFVEDLKKDPRKTLETLVDDGKDMIEDVKKDARKKIDTLVDDGKAFLKKAKKDPKKAFNQLVDDGKEFIEELKDDTRGKLDNLIEDYKTVLKGIEKDARMVKKDLLDNGKKVMDKVPGKQKIEKKISSTIKSIPSQLNMPSKKDIDSLVRGMKELNEKVDTLSKVYAA